MEALHSETGQPPLPLQLLSSSGRGGMLYEAVPVPAAQTPHPLAVYLFRRAACSGHFIETELHVVLCPWLMPPY